MLHSQSKNIPQGLLDKPELGTLAPVAHHQIIYSEQADKTTFTVFGQIKWTERERQRLFNAFALNSDEKLLVLFPGRTIKAINNKAYELGITKGQKNWTQDEIDFLFEMKKKGYSYSQIKIAMPGRTAQSLKHKVRRMKEKQI